MSERLRARLTSARAGDIQLGRSRSGRDVSVPRHSFAEHAHFLGPTGVGKTRCLQLVAEQLIAFNDCCVVVLDPHDGPEPYGGLYHALKTFCYRSGRGERLVTIDLDEIERHGIVVGFNPLRRGRALSVRAGLAAENLRSVAGITDPQAAVQLVRWSFNTFLGLLKAGLPFGDAAGVVEADDPMYREAFGEILEEDYPGVAGDWKRLVADDRRGRSAQSVFDYELGSTKRRLDAYLVNENIKRILSTERFAFDPAAAIAERRIVLANLQPRDLMETHHRKMLGTQLVHAFCRAAMDRGEHEAVPCYLIVDEFHEFLCPEVLEILNGGRKFGIHLVLAHQFLSQLQDAAKQDWRYLDAVLQNPGLRVVFGGIQWAEAEKLAFEMFNRDMDPEKIKHELYGTVQTSHVEWMNLRSAMSAQSEGRQSSDTTSRSAGRTSPIAGPPDAGSESFSDAYAAATGGNSARLTSESVAIDVPVVLPDAPRDELRSVTFWSVQEQAFLLARELKNQPRQHAALYTRGGSTAYFRVEDVGRPILTIADARVLDGERLTAATAAPSPIAAPLAVIEEESRERREAFRARLAAPLPVTDPAGAYLEARKKKPPPKP